MSHSNGFFHFWSDEKQNFHNVPNVTLTRIQLLLTSEKTTLDCIFVRNVVRDLVIYLLTSGSNDLSICQFRAIFDEDQNLAQIPNLQV